MVADRAAVANCVGLVVLWRTGLPCKTLSGHGELSLNRRHSHKSCPSKHVVYSAWAGPHSCHRVSWKYWDAWGGSIVSYSMAGGALVVGLFLACVSSVCMGCFDLPWWLLVVAPNRRCRCWVRSWPMSLWS